MALPKLPSPPPQLDFPAMEQERQNLVEGYKAMLGKLEASLAQKMDGFAQQAVKSEPVSYQQGVQAPQEARRDRIIKVLMRFGAKRADFEQGGVYFNNSDNELFDIAKAALKAHKRAAGGA